MVRYLAGCSGHQYGQCAKYAASSWSGPGVILLGVIVLIIVGLFNKNTRKLALSALAVGTGVLGYMYAKSKGMI